jgi:hypothetical protein
LGGAAGERALRYSVDSMVEGVLAIYRDVLARPAGRPPAALSESLAS